MFQNTHRVYEDLGSPLGAGVVLQEGDLHLVPLVPLETEGVDQLDVRGPGGQPRLLEVVVGPALGLRRGVVPHQLHLDPLPVPRVAGVMLVTDHGEVLRSSKEKKILSISLLIYV